jgi:nucleoside-diphosphate-sugar epimerase
MKPMRKNVLLTGASGFLGNLIALSLLKDGRSRVVAPIRNEAGRQNLIEKIQEEAHAEGLSNELDYNLIETVPLVSGEKNFLKEALKDYEIDEVINCAGSVAYFDSKSLHEGNVGLTNDLIEIAQEKKVDRFTFLSTAFSSGYVEGLVKEAAHSEALSDPTEYTVSKRTAENAIIESGLPYIIARPSIVIGDSRDGRYGGKAYGLYQLWTACERFLCDRYRPVLHLIAPDLKLQLIHQDAFTNSFMAAHKFLPPKSIVHLTSNERSLPTVREVTEFWVKTCNKPEQVKYYQSLEEVDMKQLDKRMRMWLEFTSVNTDISNHSWHFETKNLDNLRAEGVQFVDVTLNSIAKCQKRFISESSRIQAFLANNAALLAS